MNLIFDFDGTICDSFDLTVKIANEYLVRFKKAKIDPKKFRKIGIEEIIKDYKLNKLQVLIYIYKGRQEISKHIHEFKAFPGLIPVLKKLQKTNTLGIVSSNSKRNIEKFLKLNGMADIFKFVYSSSTLFQKHKKISSAMKKYNLNKKETIYIGDELRDTQAAKKIDLKAIAVSWGFADKNLLKSANPDFLIEKPEELLKVEKQLLR
jgi:HAD superfamily hydrolase (TIGR01549 family)